MSFLTTAELTQMRADVAEMLPDTCVIQSGTYVSDGAGGWTPTYTAVASGTVACRVDPLNLRGAQVGVDALAETTTLRYQLTVPHDAPLDVDYRIVTGSNTYEIIQLDADHSWNVSRRAVISRVE